MAAARTPAPITRSGVILQAERLAQPRGLTLARPESTRICGSRIPVPVTGPATAAPPPAGTGHSTQWNWHRPATAHEVRSSPCLYAAYSWRASDDARQHAERFGQPSHHAAGAGGVRRDSLPGGLAEVVPQVPAVADLHRAGQCLADGLAVGARSVPAHDPGMVPYPFFRDVGGAAGDDVDAAAGLGVDQHGRADAAAAQRDVID